MTEESSEGIEEQEVEAMSTDNSFENFIARRVSWLVLTAVLKNHRLCDP